MKLFLLSILLSILLSSVLASSLNRNEECPTLEQIGEAFENEFNAEVEYSYETLLKFIFLVPIIPIMLLLRSLKVSWTASTEVRTVHSDLSKISSIGLKKPPVWR